MKTDIKKRLILVGAGHANAHLLQHFVEHPAPNMEITVVAPTLNAPYSGMVPGWLAGIYRFEEICIDFAALARAAGAVVLADEVRGLDPERKIARLASGGALQYDVLALNIGSTLTPPEIPGKLILSMRPLGRLEQAWENLLHDFSKVEASKVTITAVGGGPAGVEALLGCLARLRAIRPECAFRGILVTRSQHVLHGFPKRTRSLVLRALKRASVDVHTGTELTADLANASDVILWATGAQPHAWPRDSGLAISERGFISVDAYLRSVSHPDHFAVGDCAEWAEPLPKAGVFAVRMGPFLVNNVCAALGLGPKLRAYQPQRRFLVLIATGDRRAIASRGGWTAGASSLVGWAMWRWKDRIDRKFLDHFRHSPTESVPSRRVSQSDQRQTAV